MRRIVFTMLLVGLLAVLSGCVTSHRVLSVDDHTSGEVTYMKTLSSNSVAGFGNYGSHVAYWECDRNAQGLNCTRTCWNYDEFNQWPANAPADAPRCSGFSGGAVVEE